MWWMFNLKKKINKCNSQLLLETLISYFDELKTKKLDSETFDYITKILCGLSLRLKMIHGQIVYEKTIMSVVNRIPEMSEEDKDSFNRCFYYIDKIFYKIDGE